MNDEIVLERALELFARHGIRKTSVEMIAVASGVTRMTLYRRFGEKEALLHRAVMHVLSVYERAIAEALHHNPPHRIDETIEAFAQSFHGLSIDDAGALVAEIETCFPHIASELKERRQTLGRSFFEAILSRIDASGLLREGYDSELVQAAFETLLAHGPDHPSVAKSGADAGTLLSQMVHLLVYGLVRR